MNKVFLLQGLKCANCASKMERSINKIKGVNEAAVNFMTSKLTVDIAEDKIDFVVSEIEKAVKKYESHVVVKCIK